MRGRFGVSARNQRISPHWKRIGHWHEHCKVHEQEHRGSQGRKNTGGATAEIKREKEKS
jgi:hypothetical protein